jgi:hypothetical protein
VGQKHEEFAAKETYGTEVRTASAKVLYGAELLIS